MFLFGDLLKVLTAAPKLPKLKKKNSLRVFVGDSANEPEIRKTNRKRIKSYLYSAFEDMLSYETVAGAELNALVNSTAVMQYILDLLKPKE